MKFLFVAPEICTPYTEGRKRFVLDLIDTLEKKDQVFLLTTTQVGQETTFSIPFKSVLCQHGAQHLAFLICNLSKVIREFNPDVVCVFPYGTFRGMYWYASTWFMKMIDLVCQKNRVVCLTIMYSIDETTTAQALQKKVSNLAISQRHGWTGNVVNVGLRYKHWEFSQSKNDKERVLLFMAGMWQQTCLRVEHIINVRGLGALLKVGELLSKKGVKLIVAAPLFANEQCRNYLLSHPLNSWPESSITLLSEVSIPDVYSMADVFVFPYQKEITQFIPSSVIESMLASTCVAMSDLNFLKPLAQNGNTAYLFPIDDINKMSEILLEALFNQKDRERKVINAREYVESNWTINISVEQIRQFVNQSQSNLV
jgi:glycosyltransferase involved in cell wall biosynthesis